MDARLHPLLAAAAAALLTACAGAGRVPEPTAKHVEFAEKGGYPATLPSLKNGRKLYLNRCSGCHTLHGPSAIPAREWPEIVLDMQNNAEINEDQVRDITRYLVALAGSAEASAAPRPMGASGTPAPATSAVPTAPATSATSATHADSAGIAPSPAPAP